MITFHLQTNNLCGRKERIAQTSLSIRLSSPMTSLAIEYIRITQAKINHFTLLWQSNTFVFRFLFCHFFSYFSSLLLVFGTFVAIVLFGLVDPLTFCSFFPFTRWFWIHRFRFDSIRLNAKVKKFIRSVLHSVSNLTFFTFVVIVVDHIFFFVSFFFFVIFFSFSVVVAIRRPFSERMTSTIMDW